MTTLSLCVIARDEEAFLPRCLASVRGLVDEIIVVDTGSRDRTPEIARAAGAIVIPYEWRDDFSDARNTAARAASSSWILSLDADEELASRGGPVIREAILGDELDALLLPLYNSRSLEATHEEILASPLHRYDEPVLVVRLIRRTEDLRWEGPIHESLGQWIERGTRRVGTVDAPIIHYGYTPEVGELRQKKARNVRMLDAWVEREPNPVAFSFLAWELMGSDRPDLRARAPIAAERGWSALERSAKNGHLEASPVALATVRVMGMLARNELSEASKTLDQAAEWGARHPNLTILRAAIADAEGRRSPPHSNERRAHFLKAKGGYRACLRDQNRMFSEWMIEGATSWAAATGLGEAEIELENFRGALEAFEVALAVRPDYLPAIFGRAESLLALGHPGPALAVIAPTLERPDVRDTSEGWLLAALASRRLGAREDAKLFYARAGQVSEQGRSSRALRLQALIEAETG